MIIFEKTFEMYIWTVNPRHPLHISKYATAYRHAIVTCELICKHVFNEIRVGRWFKLLEMSACAVSYNPGLISVTYCIFF